MNRPENTLTIIGGGLAGCEAAWQAARLGVKIKLYEMRPDVLTAAHTTANLAELVCSNSLGSNLVNRASGLLKEELRMLNSLVIEVADRHSVPAGSALAVDREGFSAEMTSRIASNPNILLVREEVQNIPESRHVVIASGPLTSGALAADIEDFTGADNLFFYDAIAPIVDINTINLDIAFRASRYGKGVENEGDYINCPMNEGQYHDFVQALISAEKISLRDFETNDKRFFEGCLPVEVLAARGVNALAYGPLRPVGLRDPKSGRRPFAVVQLRQDNAAASLFNLVGFQTNLKYDEQKRVLRMIPGLENAKFVRYGSMHRNTYINAPNVLKPTLQSVQRPDLFFCGQIAGLEGYAGNIAGGWIAGINAARLVQNRSLLELPGETMIGALIQYIAHADPVNFQPMKANFGIVPPLEKHVRGKRARADQYSARALESLKRWISDNNVE